MEMRAKARRIKARYGDLGLIVVDYLQLMTRRRAASESRQVEVSELSRGLKILARELDAPVIALSQLNRQLEYRQDKRPMLADLRESGSIEQDADVVIFIYRDEVYNPESDQRGMAEIIVPSTGTAPPAPPGSRSSSSTPSSPTWRATSGGLGRRIRGSAGRTAPGVAGRRRSSRRSSLPARRKANRRRCARRRSWPRPARRTGQR